MTLAPLLALLLSAAAVSPALADGAPPPVPAGLADGGTDATMWRASGVIAADGALRVLPGWRLRVGPGGRASLAGPTPRAPRPRGSWDDDLTVGATHVAVRVASRTAELTYVEGRLRRDGRSRAFVVRWDPASGRWSDAVAAL